MRLEVQHIVAVGAHVGYGYHAGYVGLGCPHGGFDVEQNAAGCMVATFRRPIPDREPLFGHIDEGSRQQFER